MDYVWTASGGIADSTLHTSQNAATIGCKRGTVPQPTDGGKRLREANHFLGIHF
jgi:hypothetical protein